MEEKAKLRKKFLNIRKRYKNTALDSIRVVNNLLRLPEFIKSRYILLYYPHKNEVDTRYLIKFLLKKRNKILFLPKVSGDHLKVVFINDVSSLKEGYAGIKEPVGIEHDPKIIETVIVPGIAFDIYGYRLGYGKGFYDRFLESIDAIKIGLAFDFQVIPKIPHGKFDVPVDILVTPTRIIKPKNEKGGNES